MKKFIIAFALLIGIASFDYPVQAQNINISINIGRQPAWGPVGYDYVGYYYFPDIDCYYDVNMALFYYFDRGRWVSSRYLPYAYRHYDLYRLYKVALNVRDPWRHHYNHYRDYARYRGYTNQVIIRDSRDVHYRNSRNNKVVWFSKDKSQRDYKYNYSNYRYDNRNSNNNRPNNQNYGNNRPVVRPSRDESPTRPSSNSGSRTTSTDRNGRR
jgi:hypothetical protein